MALPSLLSLLLLLLVLVLSNVAAPQSIIKNLPGFAGDLPFKLETGYIGVDHLDDVQLFYYFIESERNPEKDPLLLWLTGGPGCSGFSGLVYEIGVTPTLAVNRVKIKFRIAAQILGPLSFDYKNSGGILPNLKLNPYSWTKIANIIFLDAPVGTGFSYAKSWQGYNIMNDTLAAAQNYYFLRKWLIDHPKFLSNPLYIAGDSYSGIIVPMVVQEITNGMDAGDEPRMNIKGYVLGNPVTDANKDINSRVKFAYLKALISYDIYQATKRDCKGEYVNVDPTNGLCIARLQNVSTCIGKIYVVNILEPYCTLDNSPKPRLLNWDRSILMEEDFTDLLLSPTQFQRSWCRGYNYFYSYTWANDKSVQRTLGVREGTIKEWRRCNKSLSYNENIPSSLDYHRNLIKRGYQVLIYSGDADMVIPYVATETWIKSLNLTIDLGWQPWFVDSQVAGYWILYTANSYHLTFATVRGGGHTAPEYKPKECLAMISRWLAFYPL